MYERLGRASRHAKIRPHEPAFFQPARSRRIPAPGPGQLEHDRVHGAGPPDRPGHVRRPRRGQRLPRPARRHDHRRHLPGGGDRHGGAALFKGTLLEENFARTVGSIGESVAAGAIFTIPAFVILKLWKFDREHMVQEYLLASALMVLGGMLGIMFVTILRRVMVEDPSLPFPESVAASEIHKAGQRGAEAALQLFQAMGVGAADQAARAPASASSGRSERLPARASASSRTSFVRLGLTRTTPRRSPPAASRRFSAPAVTPAYLGVGYIIGPELGALNFAGGLLAWGLFVPLLVFFLGPALIDQYTGAERRARTGPGRWSAHLYRFIVRPDRGRRHAGGRLLHAVQDAQEPDRRASSAASPTSRSRPPPRPPPSAPSATCRSRSCCSASSPSSCS